MTPTLKQLQRSWRNARQNYPTEKQWKARVRRILALVDPQMRVVLKAAKLEPCCTLEAEIMFAEVMKSNADRT
jgi:hypothetical protein